MGLKQYSKVFSLAALAAIGGFRCSDSDFSGPNGQTRVAKAEADAQPETGISPDNPEITPHMGGSIDEVPTGIGGIAYEPIEPASEPSMPESMQEPVPETVEPTVETTVEQNPGTPGSPSEPPATPNPPTPPSKKEKEAPVKNPLDSLPEVTVKIPTGHVKAALCSPTYAVPGTANPYFAGGSAAKTISYSIFSKYAGDGTPIYTTSIDRASSEAPVLVVPSDSACVKGGHRLYFKVSGTISHGDAAPTNADGRSDLILAHQQGAIYGKSNVTAPLNSLLGVFLRNTDPSQDTPPSALNFTTPASRDYKELAPKIGQIFYIGDGKRQDGSYQRIVVPQGATRLYFGIMDGFEWKNNSGELKGAIMVEK